MSDQGNSLPMNYAAQQSSNIRFLPGGAPVVSNMMDISIFNTTIWDQWEFLTQTLYDSTVYAAAGQPSLSFFQTAVGGGVGFGGGVKSLSDTNIRLNGQLSNGQMFVVSSIEVDFQPTTPTVAAQMPAVYGAQAVAAIINDSYIFWRSGNLNLFILAKTYNQDAPMMRYPSQNGFSLQAALADSTTAGATQQSRVAFADTYGPVYSLAPNNLLIPPSTNFSVTLAWPEGNQAITNPARVFVRLGGMLARQAQ